MKLINSFTLEVKKSKFIAYFYKLNTQEEVSNIINNLKKEHKKAKHIVYAYKYGNTAGKSDDKEPTNTAGLPLYNLLEIQKINNALLVVVRYFGGIKLGAGLLTRTYKNVGATVIKKQN